MYEKFEVEDNFLGEDTPRKKVVIVDRNVDISPTVFVVIKVPIKASYKRCDTSQIHLMRLRVARYEQDFTDYGKTPFNRWEYVGDEWR